MATSTTPVVSPPQPTMATLPCCPEMVPDDTCDILDFHYRLNYPVTVPQAGTPGPIPVEVKLHFRLTRCPGPFALGNLLYTNTLLPGEKVKLFTSDRRTKFTFDSTSQVSYRNTQTAEESFFMHQMSDMLFDTSSRDSGNSSNQSHAHVDGHGDAGVDILGMGGSANMSGNFDSNSLSTFLNEHNSHAQSSANAAEMGVRKSASVSVGEVQTRTHTQTQSEDHFESSSREFSNPNKCRAVTFLFYQINKTQTVTYRLEAIERRAILDQTDFTKVALNPIAPSSGVGRTSLNLLAVDPQSRFGDGRRVIGPRAGNRHLSEPAADPGESAHPRVAAGGQGTDGCRAARARRKSSSCCTGRIFVREEILSPDARHSGQGLPGRLLDLRADSRPRDPARVGEKRAREQAAATADRTARQIAGVSLLSRGNRG
jgi:hypothetical protein